MTKTELNAFRANLENIQAELVRGTRNRESIAIEAGADELGRIQLATERDYAIGNLERSTSRLRDVRGALLRLDAGTFGICAGCEEEIMPKRLGAVPWASLCIICQEAADREEKSPVGEIDSPLELAA